MVAERAKKTESDVSAAMMVMVMVAMVVIQLTRAMRCRIGSIAGLPIIIQDSDVLRPGCD
jgi:hypothetical protein